MSWLCMNGRRGCKPLWRGWAACACCPPGAAKDPARPKTWQHTSAPWVLRKRPLGVPAQDDHAPHGKCAAGIPALPGSLADRYTTPPPFGASNVVAPQPGANPASLGGSRTAPTPRDVRIAQPSLPGLL